MAERACAAGAAIGASTHIRRTKESGAPTDLIVLVPEARSARIRDPFVCLIPWTELYSQAPERPTAHSGIHAGAPAYFRRSAPSSFERSRSKVPSGRWPALRAISSAIEQHVNGSTDLLRGTLVHGIEYPDR